MAHPLLLLAEKEQLHTDGLPRALKAATVARPPNKTNPYKISDGGGLFLLVLPRATDATRSRLWRYKYRINGQEGLYAIGSYPEIGLADARKMHRAARWLVQHGIHPRRYVEDQRRLQAEEEARKAANTFRSVCKAWQQLGTDLADATRAQRRRELDKDVLPRIGDKPIAEIRKTELKELLEDVQRRAPEVARNIRIYLQHIFEYAIEAGLVHGSPVPSAAILKKRAQVPHPALPLRRVGEFLRMVDAAPSAEHVRIALHLLLLTAVRKTELTAARWDEFDLDGAQWTIPAARMKGRKEHWVPLSNQAVALLRRLRSITSGALLFPNVRDPRRPMAGRSVNALLERLGFLSEAKPHGFRAVFSTYFNSYHWNPDVIEACLAHTPKDAIRAKYNRADYEESRRKMMQHWADHIDALAANQNVVAVQFGRVG